MRMSVSFKCSHCIISFPLSQGMLFRPLAVLIFSLWSWTTFLFPSALLRYDTVVHLFLFVKDYKDLAHGRIVIWMKRRKRQLALDNFSIMAIFIKWVACTGTQKCSSSDRMEKYVSSCKWAAPWRVDRDKCHFRGKVNKKSCLYKQPECCIAHADSHSGYGTEEKGKSINIHISGPVSAASKRETWEGQRHRRASIKV